jgi:hypothetical protein
MKNSVHSQVREIQEQEDFQAVLRTAREPETT